MNNDISFNFSNKNVLVVGGSRGIGKAIVQEFAKADAHVFYASRTPMSSRDNNYKNKVVHLACDIAKEQEIVDMFVKLDDLCEQIDFVINVAGTNLCEPISKINSDEWDRVLDINLKSFFIVSKLAVERMIPAQAGRIVNVSSIAGRHKSIVSGVHYTSSKAGIIGLTKQLAHEVAKHNILVNVVCPSQTMTEMLEQSMTPEQLSTLEGKIPVRRIATTREQAIPALFLCSSASSYITGTALDVNGGQF